MPLVQTRGAASAQGFGEFAQASAVPNYIEDVFSCFLYTGTGATQTITNNIDLSTKGGLTWIKGRSGATGHRLTDTARGVTKSLASNSTATEATESTGLTAFSTTGFTIGADADYNTSAATYVSWTFRKQPKFFDIVTYTGNGSTKTISHSLGSVPGCIIVKDTSDTFSWVVYHRSNGNDKVMYLDGTQAVSTDANVWNSYTPTATDFQVGGSSFSNSNGDTYVAYIFAHNAGGFGLTGTDNVISCGSYTGGGGVDTITLGYEPQWILTKGSSAPGQPWIITDNMRGMSYTNNAELVPNTSAAESDPGSYIRPTATGFTVEPGFYGTGATVIYIAIRRGPMKVPTVGTSVFASIARTGTGSATTVSGVGFTPDMLIDTNRTKALTDQNYLTDRLRGLVKSQTDSTDAENNWNATSFLGFTMDGMNVGADGGGYINGVTPYINWFFKRAPSFFDEVCYTATGAGTQIYTHNLGVTPEMMIVKCRSNNGTYWLVYQNSLGLFGGTYPNYLSLSDPDPKFNGASSVFGTVPTSTQFTVGASGDVGASGRTYVNYLFATCAGVSKVGSYTGTATTKQIDCGFTAGARFVLIKRTDSTGDWYVWDTARGIIAGNDPYLLLNSTAAEVTSTDYVDTYSAGFELSSTAPAAINASGGTFIFLAIA